MPSKRIKLLNCDKKILKAILDGNEALSKELNINIPKKWTEFGTPVFEYALEKINKNPDSNIWWTYLPILIETNTLIGSCGFKGGPNEMGIVEIGYEVCEQYRNKGFATEIVSLFVKMAFDFQVVKIVQALTLAEENASVKVLKKNDFQFVEELEYNEEGKIWKWKRERQHKK